MKRIFKSLALLISIGAVVSSCSKKVDPIITDPTIINPLADYTVTPDPTDAFTFKFTNLSKNYKTIEWRFGDDTLKTDDSPTHTYLTTTDILNPQKYTADLKVVSSTGNISHKYQDILIIPDSVLKITTSKTGVFGEVKYTPVVKANIKSVLWTFNTSPVTTSTAVAPIVKLAIGQFIQFSCKVTTDKGSVVTVSKYTTLDGLAADITQSHLPPPLTHSLIENTGNSNENSPKLIDGNIATKFGYYSAIPANAWIYTLAFPAPVTVKLYGIANGNDSGNSRDPKEFYFEGANDDNTTTVWTALDHQTFTKGFYDQATDAGATTDAQRYNRFWYYPIAAPQAFLFYRLRMVSFFGSELQLDEWKLFK